MDAALPSLDLSGVPLSFITLMLQSMSLSDRFTCALVCKAWAEAATAATRSIILEHGVQDLSCFQAWLEKHGGRIEVLQSAQDGYAPAGQLTALPCPQLQDLLLKGRWTLDGRVWSDIAAATKLTAVSLWSVQTASQQADVVSALTALPDLEQLTCWAFIECGSQRALSGSMLLQKLTKLTSLDLAYDSEEADPLATAAALEHLGSLTMLQDLSLCVTEDWSAAGCPGLQELKALTRLHVWNCCDDIPSSVSRLTALQELTVSVATKAALNKLSVLTGLTCLRLQDMKSVLHGSPPLQLPGLQHLVIFALGATMPMSFLGSCTQLRVLELCDMDLRPDSLLASTMLQHLGLSCCMVIAAHGAADPISWQQVFPGPGQLPHLISLSLKDLEPDLQHADMEWVVFCCSSLEELHLGTLQDSFASALARLSGLTSLKLWTASDQDCSSLAQLTGLMDLTVYDASEVFAAGLRQLAALEHLTSLGLNDLGWSNQVLREHMSDRLPEEILTYKYAIVNKGCVCVCVGAWWMSPHNHGAPTCCCCGL